MDFSIRVAMSMFGLLAAVAAAQTPSLQDVVGVAAPPAGPEVTTIYSARQFITMDAKNPIATAVAVRDGKLLAVGSMDSVKAIAGANVRVDESFADKVVTPGFVEQHVHPVLAALTMKTKVISIEDWDAIDGFSPAVRDPKGYEERLKAALAAHADKSKPFVTWGYHHYMHGDAMSRAYLDKLAADLPVVVWHRSCHEFFLNTAALKLAGIDEALIATLPEGARAQLDFAKGHFYEQGAIAVLGKVAPLIATPEIFKAGLEFTEDYYHRAGITTACEPGGFYSKPMQEAVNAVYSDKDTPFNHYFIADGKTLAAMHPKDPQALLDATKGVLSWGTGRTIFLPNQVKLLLDGAIYSQLMMMKDGYTDGHRGEWIMNPAVFDYAFQAYWDAGYQIHVHNNGDGGLDVLIASLEKAQARKPRTDHRTVLVHFGFARPEQVKRWAELGGIVSSNPYYVTALAGQYKNFGIGPERSANMVPMGDVVDNRISFSFHSDMPMAPAKPLQLIWAGVNRTTLEGDISGPRHRVTVDQALRAMTIDAAYSIQLEGKVGSLEVGKDANLTVLDQNPYEADASKVREIAVVGTMLEGRWQPVLPSSTGSRSRTDSAGGTTARSWQPARLSPDTELLSEKPASHGFTSPRVHSPSCGCGMSSALAAVIAAPAATK
jgi:predicted amidohydrolase YtcJ